MNTVLTVNEAIDALPGIAGKEVTVIGILKFEFEYFALEHSPYREKRKALSGASHISNSSIWIEIGMAYHQLDNAYLEKLNGKHVSIEGMLHSPDPAMGGSGHLSAWPASILAKKILRISKSRTK